MTEQPPAKKKCLGADCENDAGTLQCPKCLSIGIKGSFFCSQECFKKNWVCHILLLDILMSYVSHLAGSGTLLGLELACEP